MSPRAEGVPKNITLVRPVQPSNAWYPILITLLGIVTLVRLVQPRNALPPIATTGRPPIVAGMVTAPPAPM